MYCIKQHNNKLSNSNYALYKNILQTSVVLQTYYLSKMFIFSIRVGVGLPIITSFKFLRNMGSQVSVQITLTSNCDSASVWSFIIFLRWFQMQTYLQFSMNPKSITALFIKGSHELSHVTFSSSNRREKSELKSQFLGSTVISGFTGFTLI